MAKEQLTLHGEPVGRIKAGWILFKETLRFLWLDKEMLWVPLIACFINLFLFGFVIFIMALVLSMVGWSLPDDSPIWYLFVFLLYIAGSFTYAFSQASITHIVYTRAHGGDATLGQGLKRALSHWFTLLLWSIITSTVGVVLKMISDRSKLLGRIIASLLGVGWSVLTYFVVPAMVIDNTSAFAAIGKSGQVFKKTWGETLVSNISYGLVLFLINIFAAFSFLGIIIGAFAVQMPLLAFMFMGMMFIYFILMSLISSALSGVLKTLLYIYASEGVVPQNFDSELIEKMLARDKANSEPAPAAMSEMSSPAESHEQPNQQN